MLAVSCMIDVIWVCDYTDHEDGTCTIHSIHPDNDTDHRIGFSNCWDSLEGPKRVVHTLEVGPSESSVWPSFVDHDKSQLLEVRNPQNIFSYKRGK